VIRFALQNPFWLHPVYIRFAPINARQNKIAVRPQIGICGTLERSDGGPQGERVSANNHSRSRDQNHRRWFRKYLMNPKGSKCAIQMRKAYQFLVGLFYLFG